MKTEAKIECAVKIGKSFEVGNFRGVLKIDEGEEEILTMSGRKDFPAAFLAKLLLPASPVGYSVLDEGAPLHVTRRLELINLRTMEKDINAWNVNALIGKRAEDGHIEYECKVTNENDKFDPTIKRLGSIRKVLPHTETIHARTESQDDGNYRIWESTSFLYFLLEDTSLLQGCLFTTWKHPIRFVIPPGTWNVKHNHLQVGFNIEGHRMRMFGKKEEEEPRGEEEEPRGEEEEPRGEKRGWEGEDQVGEATLGLAKVRAA